MKMYIFTLIKKLNKIYLILNKILKKFDSYIICFKN